MTNDSSCLHVTSALDALIRLENYAIGFLIECERARPALELLDELAYPGGDVLLADLDAATSTSFEGSAASVLEWAQLLRNGGGDPTRYEAACGARS